jgi:drug/metabolite transporter (DMT)-like permease
MLALLASLQGRFDARAGSWGSAAALAGYAVAFSFAYGRVEAGAGALVLFGAVQAGMIGWSAWRGERPKAREAVGLGVAFAGLVVLVRPGRSAPDPLGLGLMTLAGLCWAAYTLRGKAASDPLATNAGNFLRSVPLALLGLPFAATLHAAPRGLALAAASGAVASGVGYTLWYAALRGLMPTQAAIVQLAVPALAAAGGVVLLGEAPTLRLLASGLLILGGIALALRARR